MKKILLLISILACILLNAEIVTRQSIISQAKVYAEYNWKVNTPNPRYAQYKTKGTQITGVAYSYGDKDNTSAFQSDINAGVMPRNWMDNYNEGNTTGYTGIDCSGLVTDCWDVNIHGGAALVGLCMDLPKDKSLLKMGDALRKPGHIQLYAWNDSVFEAVGLDDTTLFDWHKVRLSAMREGYTFHSIFPQFSKLKPENKDTITIHNNPPRISLRIEGSGEIGNVKMWLDGDTVSPNIRGGKNKKNVSYKPDSLSKGLHIVKVYSTNSISGNFYEDTTEWSFNYGITENTVKITDSIPWTLVPYAGYVFFNDSIEYNYIGGQVIFASDSLGLESTCVDDIIEMTVVHPDGTSSLWTHNYAPTKGDIPLPPVDLSSLFKIGVNKVKVILKDDPDHALYYGSTPLWLVGTNDKERISLSSIKEYKASNIDSSNVIKPYKLGTFFITPNPFMNDVRIQYGISKTVHTNITIYNTAGQLVKVLVDEDKEAGYYSANWDGKDNNGKVLPSGMYFYRLNAGDFKETIKILKIK
ncbi:MAG: T9SS type A sorting domain-containing protein [bacterium]